MRKEFDSKVETARCRTGQLGSKTGDDYGYFKLKLKPGGPLANVIVSSGEIDTSVPWDHVSVSFPNRCPTWEEMCIVKDMFFEPTEWVVQFHPPTAENISNHPFCLHLWRPILGDLPVPPSIAVGIKEIGEIDSPEKAKLARELIDKALGR